MKLHSDKYTQTMYGVTFEPIFHTMEYVKGAVYAPFFQTIAEAAQYARERQIKDHIQGKVFDSKIGKLAETGYIFCAHATEGHIRRVTAQPGVKLHLMPESSSLVVAAVLGKDASAEYTTVHRDNVNGHNAFCTNVRAALQGKEDVLRFQEYSEQYDIDKQIAEEKRIEAARIEAEAKRAAMAEKLRQRNEARMANKKVSAPSPVKKSSAAKPKAKKKTTAKKAPSQKQIEAENKRKQAEVTRYLKAKPHTVYGIAACNFMESQRQLQRQEFALDQTVFDVYQTVEAAMQAIQSRQATVGQVDMVYADSDKFRQFPVEIPQMYVLQPLITSEYEYLTLRTMSNNSPCLGQCTTNKDTEIWASATKTDIPALVLGRDKAGPAQIITAETPEQFAQDALQVISARLQVFTSLAEQQMAAEKEQRAQSTFVASKPVQLYEAPEKDSVNAGWRLIERHADALISRGYEAFAKELIATYERNTDKLQDFEGETKQSAYHAMESVFDKVQRAAAKTGDFETATAAQQVARAAGDALYDMKHEQPASAGISREEAAQYGIYVPEEIEV